MLTRRPALRFLVLYIVGIICAYWLFINPLWIYFSILIFVVPIIILTLIYKWHIIFSIFLHLLVLLLGLLLHSINQLDYESSKLEPSVQNEKILIYGIVDSEPIKQERRFSFVVKTDSIKREFKIDRRGQRILITLRNISDAHNCANVEFGKRIFLEGILEAYPFKRNPGEYDFGKYLELNNIQGIVNIKSFDKIIAVESMHKNNFRHWTYSIQQKLYAIIDKFHTQRHASFLKGIIFGYRAEIPVDIKQSFIDTGTIHILAVSGSNVAFVAFMFYTVFGFFRLPRKYIALATIIGLIFYMLVTGSSPSVVRATIMAIVILCATLYERKPDIYNSISVAALILLIWDTNFLFDIGFQLSFSAVIAIVFLYPRFEALINKIPTMFEEIKAIDFVLKLMAVSLAALLGTIPFTAYYFGRISIISLVANILAVPIAGFNTFLGFTEIIFSFINDWIASLYAAVNDFLVWLLLGFVKQAANVPYAYLEFSNFNFISCICYFLIIGLIININKHRTRKIILFICLLIGNFFVYSSIIYPNRPNFSLTMIDVGQGDAILTEFSNGKRILIDAGAKSKIYDAGIRTIIPLLKNKGVDKLDYLLITHPHNDHIGGASSIINKIKVDTLIVAMNKINNHQLTTLLQEAIKYKIGVKHVESKSQIYVDPNSRVYVLHPSAYFKADRNQNNNTIVLKVLYGESSILFTGDAETEVENILISKYGNFLSSNILKVGHHGSMTSTSEEFIRYVKPKIALISVGTRNKFNHPSKTVLDRLLNNSIVIHRTDKSGAVIYESYGSNLQNINWR